MVSKKTNLFPRQFLLTLSLPFLLVIIGTFGYYAIEGWPLFDCLYMSVITLTTIGFREVHDLSVGGRVFTMVLALGGIFTFFYAASALIAGIVGGELLKYLGSRRMERSLSEMKDHLIVCGLGRMGRLVCQEFSSLGIPFVIIDKDEEMFERFDLPHGIPLHGDATSDEVLRHAGIERAKSLISVVASDADNLYIVMSARLLSEKVFIVARAEDERSEQKLLRAGANRVVSPYMIGGSRVAQAVLRPTVVDFLELATRSEHLELNIEETQLNPKSSLVGKSLEKSNLRTDYHLIIVAIKKTAGHMVYNPGSEFELEAGDILIMLGRREELDRVAKIAAA